MGFFSWKCAVTGDSIPAFPYAGRPERLSKVVMVLPDNKLVSGVYDGYGHIGGQDVYDLIVPYYFGVDEPVRELLFNRNKYITSPGGEQVTVDVFSWEEPLPGFGKMTLNELRQKGYTIETDFDRLRAAGMIKIVRQDAFTGQAHDELPASEDCPDQGYFYES
jgi:hypothetical protein